jgi:hypothetical protein
MGGRFIDIGGVFVSVWVPIRYFFEAFVRYLYNDMILFEYNKYKDHQNNYLSIIHTFILLLWAL